MPLEEQPTEAQELANAAYVWRKQVQSDLLEALRDPGISPEKADFWFERFRRAQARELVTSREAKEVHFNGGPSL